MPLFTDMVSINVSQNQYSWLTEPKDKIIHIYKKFPCGRNSLRVLKKYTIDDLNEEIKLFMGGEL